MKSVSLASIKAATELTSGQVKAIAKLFGPEYVEGAIYRRTEPDVDTVGDIYIACSKLGKGANGESGFNMLNLTRSDRKHVLAKFDSAKFELVSKAAKGTYLR